ncbi:hypothetical protein [Salidesulfovibrio onnuriiensis]|uniref:hypothetical protein n=1 Tax=Salidesulfovibrio onnuriiensis TaxID=2583823 RepID=UPI0011C98B6C|nr:hypothetical protein [Salidesulfovibrio onnuriiensis]
MRRKKNRLTYLLLCAVLLVSLAGICLAHVDGKSLSDGRVAVVLDDAVPGNSFPLSSVEAPRTEKPSDLGVLNAWRGLLKQLCEEDGEAEASLVERVHQNDFSGNASDQEDEMDERKGRPETRRAASPLLRLN